MNKRIKSLVLGASLVASMAVLGGCGSNNIGYVDSVKVANSTEKGIEITKEINAKKAELDAKIAAADEASKQNVFNQAYGIGSQVGVMLPYGRMQESEADEIGIYLMHKAGYNMQEALKFWENMSEGKTDTNEFLSTHPSSSTRIEDIKKVIAKVQTQP